MADGYSYSIFFSSILTGCRWTSVGGLSRREASHWPHAFPSSLVLVYERGCVEWHHDKTGPFFGDSKRKPGQWFNDGQGTFPFESKERCATGQCFWDELLVWASWIRKWQPKICKRELTFLEKENAVRMHQEQIVSPRPASATTNELGGNISLLLNNFLFRCTNSSDVPKPVVATTTDYSHCTTTTLLKKMML